MVGYPINLLQLPIVDIPSWLHRNRYRVKQLLHLIVGRCATDYEIRKIEGKNRVFFLYFTLIAGVGVGITILALIPNFLAEIATP